MDEAQTLFRDAVLAIRNEDDKEGARKMLMQSLKLQPHNEMAWLWMARVLDEPRQQLDCIERALKINPENEQALTMREELLVDLFKPKKTTQTTVAAPVPTPPITPPIAQSASKKTQTLTSTAVSTPSTAPIKKTQTVTTSAVSATSVKKTQTATSAVVPAAPTAPVKKKTQTMSVAAVTALANVDDPRRTTTTGRTIPARQRRELSLNEKRRISMMLDKAENFIEEEQYENAIELWVKILQIQDDHEEAIRNAVRYLSRLGYMDDAKELVWRAINNGTDHPSIYLTAIEIAEREDEKKIADDLRSDVVRLPQANESVVIAIADYYIRTKHNHRAIEILKESRDSHPNSQKILVRLGDLHQEQGKEREAAVFFDRAAALGTGTKEGKAADKKMKEYVPIMTDKERGSLFMAWREAFGFGAAFLLLAFQDAGLNLMRLGGMRWAGVGLGVIGGYLLITATSSPQQRGLARLFGGSVPDDGYDGEEHAGVIEQETSLPIMPVAARAILGLIGSAMLIGAFMMVFSTALHLLTNFHTPYVPEFCDAIYFYDDELNRMIGC